MRGDEFGLKLSWLTYGDGEVDDKSRLAENFLLCICDEVEGEDGIEGII